MFSLAVIEDEVALGAASLKKGQHVQALLDVIEEKFIDRVIPGVGLVIAFYDFLSVRDAFIFPGDLRDSQGEAACTVQFRLIVFQPTNNQIMTGKIAKSTTNGLQVSMNFFCDIDIPAHALRQPSFFDERTRTWVWQFLQEGKTPQNFFYAQGEEIAFRVKTVLDGDDGKNSAGAAQRLQLNRQAGHQKLPAAPGRPNETAADGGRAAQPLVVVGAVEADGLGLLSWWL